LRNEAQKDSAPMPLGLITPIPVTATRRRAKQRIAEFILTLGERNSFIAEHIIRLAFR
jgi:hypothetical protein